MQERRSHKKLWPVPDAAKFCEMSTLVASEAHFAARCSQIGFDDAALKEVQRLKLITIGKFAYAVGQPGVPLSDADWSK